MPPKKKRMQKKEPDTTPILKAMSNLEKFDGFLGLPKELRVYIIVLTVAQLPYSNLGNYKRVCKDWNILLDSRGFRNQYIETFQIGYNFVMNMMWVEIFVGNLMYLLNILPKTGTIASLYIYLNNADHKGFFVDVLVSEHAITLHCRGEIISIKEFYAIFKILCDDRQDLLGMKMVCDVEYIPETQKESEEYKGVLKRLIRCISDSPNALNTSMSWFPDYFDFAKPVFVKDSFSIVFSPYYVYHKFTLYENFRQAMNYFFKYVADDAGRFNMVRVGCHVRSFRKKTWDSTIYQRIIQHTHAVLDSLTLKELQDLVILPIFIDNH